MSTPATDRAWWLLGHPHPMAMPEALAVEWRDKGLSCVLYGTYADAERETQRRTGQLELWSERTEAA